MALLELKGYGVAHGTAGVAGINLVVEPGTMLAVVGRGDETISLLALAIAGLLPKGAVVTGAMTFSGKQVLYLDSEADASAVTAEAELIVADEPGRGRDPATQLQLLEALQQASRTAAVIIFTADFRLALSMGLEVAVIADGKLLLMAPASQIFELPQYDTVRHLVGGERVRTRTLMRPPIGEPVLELDGVKKSYRRGLPRLGPPPVEALKGVGFAVRQGEVVGVLGLKGAGKSTLLRLIAGLERPNAGRMGRRDGLVAYVFSDPRRAFNPTLAVGMSLTEPLRVEQTLLVEEQADRLVEVVRAVGLEPDLLRRLPGELGVADLQRLALARALAGRPNLLLLDDPTAYLDPAEAREFLVLFSRVRADFGLTAIVASREFEVMRAVTDRVLVLDGGQIVEGGKSSELGDAPKHEMTRRLVSLRYPRPAKLEPVVAVEPVVVNENDPGQRPVDLAPAQVEPSGGAEPVPVVAPSTTLPGGPPPPPVPEVVATEPAQVTANQPSLNEAPVDLSSAPTLEQTAVEGPADVAAPSTAPGEPQSEEQAVVVATPEPEPVHNLSAAIVIAPVVLAEPLVVPAQSSVEEVLIAPIVGLSPVTEVAEAPVVADPEPARHSEPIPAPEAVPVEAEPSEVAVETNPVEPVVEPEPVPVAYETPELPPSEPPPALEPVAPSDDGADEAAEGGEVEVVVDGVVDAAGGAEAPDGKVGR